MLKCKSRGVPAVWILIASTLVTMVSVPDVQATEDGGVIRIEAETGYPITPQCGQHHNEYPGPENYVQTPTMFFPEHGCVVQYNPKQWGVRSTDNITIQSIRYTTTGEVTTICGSFEFSGRVSGSAGTCEQNDRWITLNFETTHEEENEYILVTWFPTGETWYNAYLDYIEIRVFVPAPDPDEVVPPPPSPPPRDCNVQDPWCLTSCPVGYNDNDCLVYVPPPDANAICNSVARQVGQTCCVMGNVPGCLLPAPCVVGPATRCIISVEGCFVGVQGTRVNYCPIVNGIVGTATGVAAAVGCTVLAYGTMPIDPVVQAWNQRAPQRAGIYYSVNCHGREVPL